MPPTVLARAQSVRRKLTVTPIGTAAVVWVDWFHHGCLLQSISHIPPVEADDRYDTPLRKKGPGSETQEKQPATILERFKLFSVWPNSIRVGDRRYQGFEVPLHTTRLGLPASKQCEGIHGLKYRHSPAAHGLATKCPRRA